MAEMTFLQVFFFPSQPLLSMVDQLKVGCINRESGD